jgi:hypothetical protein
MRRRIKLTTRRDLTAAIGQRYQAADRNEKKLILDEFVKLTSYHRKHAIRRLTREGPIHQGRQVEHRTYLEAVKEALIVLWETSDRICGKRLKSLLPSLIDAMERHGHLHLQDCVKEQLLAISAATIDRLLRPVREMASGGRKKKAARLSRVRKLVPVRSFADWEDIGPGFMDMDMVVHNAGDGGAGCFYLCEELSNSMAHRRSKADASPGSETGKHGRTRPDLFAAVWPVLLGWLEERPDMEAKSMFKRERYVKYMVVTVCVPPEAVSTGRVAIWAVRFCAHATGSSATA